MRPIASATEPVVKQLEFAPERIEVAAGTTVVWTNDAPLPHSIVADACPTPS